MAGPETTVHAKSNCPPLAAQITLKTKRILMRNMKRKMKTETRLLKSGAPQRTKTKMKTKQMMKIITLQLTVLVPPIQR